jgi:hypothetical protein
MVELATIAQLDAEKKRLNSNMLKEIKNTFKSLYSSNCELEELDDTITEDDFLILEDTEEEDTEEEDTETLSKKAVSSESKRIADAISEAVSAILENDLDLINEKGTTSKEENPAEKDEASFKETTDNNANEKVA